MSNGQWAKRLGRRVSQRSRGTQRRNPRDGTFFLPFPALFPAPRYGVVTSYYLINLKRAIILPLSKTQLIVIILSRLILVNLCVL